MSFAGFERRWARVLFQALYPQGAHPLFAHGLSAPEADRVLDEALAHWPLPGLLALRAAIWVLTLSPLFVVGRARTLGGLPAEERTRVLARLYESPIYLVRNFVVLAKTLAGIHYIGQPAVRSLVAPRGAPPPALLNELVRSKRPPQSIEPAEAPTASPASSSSTTSDLTEVSAP